MHGQPNITKPRRRALSRSLAPMMAGFVAMVAGLLLGTALQRLKADQTPIHGARLAMVMQLTHSGPEALRRAGIAAMADGVLTMGEERRLYAIADAGAATQGGYKDADPINVAPPHGPVHIRPPARSSRDGGGLI